MNTIEKTVLSDKNEERTEKASLYKRPNRVYLYTLLVCIGVFLGFLSLLTVARYKNIATGTMFTTYMKNTDIVLLNIVPPVLLLLLLYFVTNRAWTAYLLSSAVVLGFSLVHYVKVILRSDPLVMSDLTLIAEANNMMANYSLAMNWRYIVLPAAVILGTVFCALLLKEKSGKAAVRIICIVLLVALSVYLIKNVYLDDTLYDNTVNEAAYEAGLSKWSNEHKFVSLGFVYPFLHSIKDLKAYPPAGYDEDYAAELLSEYTYDDIPADKKVDVISIMLEAYSDISRFTQLGVHEDVYAPLYRLMEESYSGTLVPNVNGAGTVNTEHCFLTGYLNLITFRKSVNSFVRYFGEQGYHTEGFHAGDSWFYNRENVNRYLGYDTYYFLENTENANRYDTFFFQNVKRMYDERDKTIPYFSYNLTYQNHGPYWDGALENTFLDNDTLSEKSYNIINNYLLSIADTTKRIVSFVDSFRDSEDPVIIILYGDHMPWMGDSSSVLLEAGLSIDPSTEDGFYNLYSTPYIIWANEAAKETLGCDFVGKGEDLSPAFLIPKLFSLCSWGGNELIKADMELMEHASVIHTTTGMAVENNVFTSELSEENRKLLSDLKILQYRLMTEKVTPKKKA